MRIEYTPDLSTFLSTNAVHSERLGIETGAISRIYNQSSARMKEALSGKLDSQGKKIRKTYAHSEKLIKFLDQLTGTPDVTHELTSDQRDAVTLGTRVAIFTEIQALLAFIPEAARGVYPLDSAPIVLNFDPGDPTKLTPQLQKVKEYIEAVSYYAIAPLLVNFGAIAKEDTSDFVQGKLAAFVHKQKPEALPTFLNTFVSPNIVFFGKGEEVVEHYKKTNPHLSGSYPQKTIEWIWEALIGAQTLMNPVDFKSIEHDPRFSDSIKAFNKFQANTLFLRAQIAVQLLEMQDFFEPLKHVLDQLLDSPLRMVALGMSGLIGEKKMMTGFYRLCLTRSEQRYAAGDKESAEFFAKVAENIRKYATTSRLPDMPRSLLHFEYLHAESAPPVSADEEKTTMAAFASAIRAFASKQEDIHLRLDSVNIPWGKVIDKPVRIVLAVQGENIMEIKMIWNETDEPLSIVIERRQESGNQEYSIEWSLLESLSSQELTGLRLYLINFITKFLNTSLYTGRVISDQVHPKSALPVKKKEIRQREEKMREDNLLYFSEEDKGLFQGITPEDEQAIKEIIKEFNQESACPIERPEHNGIYTSTIKNKLSEYDLIIYYNRDLSSFTVLRIEKRK